MIFDTMILGQVCLDTNTDYDGTVEHRYGGAVLFSGHAAAAMGNKVAVVPKRDPATVDLADAFTGCDVTVFPRSSKHSTLMENTYFTADRERRRSRCTASIEPYTPDDIPSEETRLYHIAGLVQGDISGDVISACHKLGDTALDVQCMLRRIEIDGSLALHDWDEKREYIPLIKYLKTDAAEAEILTGLTDRDAAARLMCSWGAKEVMITHNSEVIVCSGDSVYRQPLKPRGLGGRTGRGDTCFSCYITERLHADIPTALLYAAALVSLKMETPGPFKGSRSDVEAFIESYYK